MGKINELGTLTVGVRTDECKTLNVVNFVRAVYVDDRVVGIQEIEDDSILITVQNPVGSEREANVNMWLTKESFMGVLATAFVYLECKGEDSSKLLEKCIDGNELEYFFSDNLKPFK